MKTFSKILFFHFLTVFTFSYSQKITAEIIEKITVDSLGACQGVFAKDRKIFLYGDREVGVLRQYVYVNGKLQYLGRETKLTVNGEDIINHPTGIALLPNDKKVYIGNSSRMNVEGTQWKANMFELDWKKLLKAKTIDEVAYREIADDAAVQGTRPIFVEFEGKNYIATADYGNKRNEVRLYSATALSKAKSTDSKGVLKFNFECSPWVQNLFFIKEKNILVLVQNQIEGKYWRLTFLDFEKSIQLGKEKVIDVLDIDDSSELEGFAMIDGSTAIAVTSSRKNNVTFLKLNFD